MSQIAESIQRRPVNLKSLDNWVFIAGRPGAALVFWFFVDYRCGALLFMVINVIYEYKNR